MSIYFRGGVKMEDFENQEFDVESNLRRDDDDDESQSIHDLYLIFHLGDEDYGIEIIHVTEIVGMQTITKIPDMPHYVKGVINLRGQVIPVIDVRSRFGLPFRDYDDRTCAIVVSIGQTLFGLIVDVVDEVINIPADRISLPLTANFAQNTAYIKGIGRVEGDNKVKIILDAAKLLNGEQIDLAT